MSTATSIRKTRSLLFYMTGQLLALLLTTAAAACTLPSGLYSTRPLPVKAIPKGAVQIKMTPDTNFGAWDFTKTEKIRSVLKVIDGSFYGKNVELIRYTTMCDSDFESKDFTFVVGFFDSNSYGALNVIMYDRDVDAKFEGKLSSRAYKSYHILKGDYLNSAAIERCITRGGGGIDAVHQCNISEIPHRLFRTSSQPVYLILGIMFSALSIMWIRMWKRDHSN
jgi:hypothetical protein